MNRKDKKAWILNYLRRETGIQTITESSSLKEDLGLDSLDMYGIAVHAREELGKNVSDKELKQWKTVADVLNAYDAA